MSITVKSSAFSNNEPIPKQFTGDGQDISPPLSWTGLPKETAELALILDDPDAPTAEPWVHWVLYKIPAATDRLEERIPTDEKLSKPAGALQGKNNWNTAGYRGPSPPKGHGVHHYHFKLYALDRALDVKAGLSKKDLLAAMKGRVIAQGELIGTYARN